MTRPENVVMQPDGISTDAYVFLNINHPVCAWATYRGALVSAPSEPGFVSVWSAGLLGAGNAADLERELALEGVRLARHETKISRLRGMFCFLDLESAERACAWATGPRSHFRPEYLAELHLGEADPRRDRFDANWISYGDKSYDWLDKYWNGEPVPGKEPIWETLIDGRALVLGTALRERAYAIIKANFPDSLCFLEIGRQAAWVGSDVGNISARLVEEGDDIALHYLLNMKEANDPEFIAKLQKYRDDGLPVNEADINQQISRGSFGKTPDLRPLGFRRPKAEMPYVKKAPF